MTEIDFRGRVAVVTGAGGGLGRSHALDLARRGARVVVNDIGGSSASTPGEPSAEKVVSEIHAAGGEAVANTDSVATSTGGAAIVETALRAFGRVDIVVNNAGILRDKAFHNMSADMVDAVVDTHLKGAFHVTQPAFRVMREQGYGRIVNTTSASGLYGNFGQANYGAAKAGLAGFTRVLALEGLRHDIKVNAIAPLAQTRMTEDMFGSLGEKLVPETVTPAVAYLASEACSVTGAIYSVAGGRVARIFLAETPGYVLPELTPEAVRDCLAQVDAEDEYVVPASLPDAVAIVRTALLAPVVRRRTLNARHLEADLLQ
jgi:NAD(P)-dependent dehydrogenase (short-subunit alcohol dehydrogenase family)